MTAKPRIAVFGAGLVGRRHIEEVARQAELCAIVDPSEAVAEVAATYSVPHFINPGDCLRAVKPDGVIIATPNQTHTDIALECLSKNIPILIEKPIADTLENAERIVVAAGKTGVPVLVGHHRRHNPIVTRVRDEIQSGSLGDIVAVTGQFWLYKPDDYFSAGWRLGPGAGPAMINFIHDVDLLRTFCGPILEVQAMRSNAWRGQEVEETAAILLRFENGALGTFSLSDTIAAPWSWEMTSGENPVYPHRPGSCYFIGGTKASLSIPDLQLWSHDTKRSWWEPISPQTLQVQEGDAFQRQLTHFLDVIDGAAPLVSAKEGRDSLAVVLKVLKAPLSSQRAVKG